MLSLLRRILARGPEHSDTLPVASDPALVALRARVEEVERKEAVRSAEWTDTLDRFERLYKRLAAREARAEKGKTPPDDRSPVLSDSESPLEMRRRMRGV